MCVWLPNFPIQRIVSRQPELRECPCLLYGSGGSRGVQVVACSREAIAKGAMLGMPLAEAQALFDTETYSKGKTPFFLPHDSEADEAALRSLAWQCQSFAPLVGIERFGHGDTLLLDITGCSHLFGGEKELACQVAHALHRSGFFPHLGVANTIGAAWAIAHYGAYAVRQPQCLNALPVEALRLPDEIIRTLYELDLRRIEQLIRLPRTCLPSRFGTLLTKRIDQAFGRIPEELIPERPAQPIEVRQSFEYPISNRSVLDLCWQPLLERLLEMLRGRNEGILQFAVHLTSAENKTVAVSVGLVQPSTTLLHLLELLHMQLERQALPDHVTDIRIRVIQTASLESRQRGLFDEALLQDGEWHLTRLVDRLSSRIGTQSVLHARQHPDVQPENSVCYTSVIKANVARSKKPNRDADACQQSPSTAVRIRPLRMCDPPLAITVTSVVPDGPPIRFYWKGQTHTVIHRWGPERIETGWWRECPIRRDYYRVEVSTGCRFWLFRDRDDGQWYLHGIFD